MAVRKTADSLSACNDIINNLKAGQIAPVYLLMGEESYYIDLLTSELQNSLLKPEERDFNLLTMFGAETDVATVMNAARGFPMGAQRLVVCVHEAARLSNIEQLVLYLKKPQPSTVLIICYKYGRMDGRNKLINAIKQCGGVVFDSPKLKDYQMPAFIKRYARQHNVVIDEKAVEMLVEAIGADLSRTAGELDKLMLSVSPATHSITSELVEHVVGISKEFNTFELLDAIVKKDIYKANKIANYFTKMQRQILFRKHCPCCLGFSVICFWLIMLQTKVNMDWPLGWDYLTGRSA